MQLLIDMNLSPEWSAALARHGLDAIHWSNVGPANSDDSVLMAWALANERIILTHDLDFGTTLALTHAAGPSVFQIRGPDVLPEDIEMAVVSALRQFETDLSAGALEVLEPKKLRVRLLPL